MMILGFHSNDCDRQFCRSVDFLNEMHAEQLAWAIALDNQPIISAANVLETSIVLRSKKRLSGVEAERWFDRFIEQGRLFIAEVTSEQSIFGTPSACTLWQRVGA